MSSRFSRVATVVLVFAAMVLMSGRSWGIYYGLAPSKDDWKLKYDIEVKPAAGDMLTVTFTLADEGRLKPIHSITVIAFSKQTDSQGGRAYDVKAPIELKAMPDGKRVGQVEIRKEFADRAMIRILTQKVDGQRQPSGGACYDLPLSKFLNRAPVAALPETSDSAEASASRSSAEASPSKTR